MVRQELGSASLLSGLISGHLEYLGRQVLHDGGESGRCFEVHRAALNPAMQQKVGVIGVELELVVVLVVVLGSFGGRVFGQLAGQKAPKSFADSLKRTPSSFLDAAMSSTNLSSVDVMCECNSSMVLGAILSAGLTCSCTASIDLPLRFSASRTRLTLIAARRRAADCTLVAAAAAFASSAGSDAFSQPPI